MSEKDENIRVLDFLERGRSGGKDEPTVQGVGTEHFTLLEVVVREGERPKGGQNLYIGEGDRDVVEYIKSRIEYDDLTATAKNELKYVLEAIVRDREEEYVEFYNEATPVTPRRHAFELLPGIGAKNRDKLIDAREQQSFESFEDIADRAESISDPVALIVDRVMKELKGEAKRKLFT
jgi:putative nucleotide binding protein